MSKPPVMLISTPSRAAHGDDVEQRIGDRAMRRIERAVRAFGFRRTHHRRAHFGHYRAHVGEIEIDQARHDHEIGDAAHAGIEHLVGHLKRFGERRALIGDPEQVLVRDHDQRIDVLAQLLHAALGQMHAALAFEVERLGDDRDGEDAALARGARDDRGRARSGTAAHAGGNEHHVCAFEKFEDFGLAFLRRRLADFRAGAGAQALGDGLAELDAVRGLGPRQRLRVGIGDNEFNALQPGVDHVVDGITACPADAENHDARLQFVQGWCTGMNISGILDPNL